MYCAFCGSPIDRTTMRCACGHSAPSLRGGNSFQELLRRDAVNEQPQATNNLPKNEDNEGTEGQLLSKVLGSVACICLLAVIILLVLLSRQSQKLDTYEVLNSQLSKQVDELKSTPETEESLPEEISGHTESVIAVEPVFSITKHPVSEKEILLGTSNTVLICRAKGETLTFTWKKYDPDTLQWVTIGDEDSLFQVVSDGESSSLIVINAGQEHVGTFLCVVTQADGSVLYSAPAELNVLSPLPTVGEIAEYGSDV